MAKHKRAPFITIRDLKRSFKLGDTLVRQWTAWASTWLRASFCCLMGPSGSGKTTLLNMIGGLDRPTEAS